MRFAVPQFIDIEDRLFGPLTWRQFIYLGGGVGGAVGLFLLLPTAVALVPAGLLAATGVALAFIKYNDRPFIRIIEAGYYYLTKKKLYLWRSGGDVVYAKGTPATPATGTTPIGTTNRGTAHKSITSLTRSLELKALET